MTIAENLFLNLLQQAFSNLHMNLSFWDQPRLCLCLCLVSCPMSRFGSPTLHSLFILWKSSVSFLLCSRTNIFPNFCYSGSYGRTAKETPASAFVFCSMSVTSDNNLVFEAEYVIVDICFNTPVTTEVPYELLREHYLRRMPFEARNSTQFYAATCWQNYQNFLSALCLQK
jgi:hypothetical protein